MDRVRVNITRFYQESQTTSNIHGPAKKAILACFGAAFGHIQQTYSCKISLDIVSQDEKKVIEL